MRTALVLLCLLAFGLAGCHRRPRAPQMPARPAARPPVVLPPAEPQARPMEEPELPAEPLPPPTPTPEAAQPKLEPAPPPAQPQPRRARPAPRKAAKPSEPEPTVPTPVATPALPAPQLGEVLPEAQRRALEQTLEESLAAARRVLAALERRKLTRPQAESAGRVRAFVRQAEANRATNLTGAVQFARRAAVLADDLAESVR